LKSYAKKYNITKLKAWQYYNNIYGNKIEEMYCSGYFLNDIKNKFNFNTDYIIVKILESRNIKLRTASENKKIKDIRYIDSTNNRKYKINHNYFKQWSNNMAYILGFIYADGCITNNSLRIVIQKKDKNLLEIIKKEIGANTTIHDEVRTLNNKQFYSSALIIKSVKIIEDLIKLGVVENKSLVIHFPQIPSEYILDFIRGYFDGDGSVGIQYPSNSKGVKTSTAQIRTRICSGSKDFLVDMRDILFDKYNLRNVTVYKCKTNLYEIAYSTKNSIEIYNLFYQNPKCLFLQRKKDSFDKFIQTRMNDLRNKTTT